MNGQVPQENNQNNLNAVGLGEVQNLGNLDPNVNVNVPTDNEIINNIGVTATTVENIDSNLDKTTVIEPVINPVAQTVEEPVISTTESSSSIVDNSSVYTATNNSVQMLEQTPIEQSIPIAGTDTINTVNTTDFNQSNSFVEPTVNENIGVTPPEKKSNKKPFNKVILIILIIAIIAGIGYGVYFYLNLAKKSKVKLTPKDIVVHIGTALPGNPADYATIEDGDIKNCKVSTINVNNNVFGEYEYTIICGNDIFKGKVTIADIEKPLATPKNVLVIKGGNVKADDFSIGCTKEVCNYSFVNEASIQEQLKTEGEYIVDIKIVDGAKNESNFKSIMYVVSSDTNVVMDCKSQEEIISLNNVQGIRKVVNDLISINNSNMFGGFSKRLYTYTFHDKEIYEQFAKDKPEELTIENNTGQAIYNEASLSITIKNDLTMETLNSEFDGTFPQVYGLIRGNYEYKKYNIELIRFEK